MDFKRFAGMLANQFEEAMDGACTDEGPPPRPEFQLDHVAADKAAAFVQISQKKSGAETAVIVTTGGVYLDYSPQPVIEFGDNIDLLAKPYVFSRRTKRLDVRDKKDRAEIVAATFANARKR